MISEEEGWMSERREDGVEWRTRSDPSEERVGVPAWGGGRGVGRREGWRGRENDWAARGGEEEVSTKTMDPSEEEEEVERRRRVAEGEDVDGQGVRVEAPDVMLSVITPAWVTIPT